jgi:hypothetical protein
LSETQQLDFIKEIDTPDLAPNDILILEEDPFIVLSVLMFCKSVSSLLFESNPVSSRFESAGLSNSSLQSMVVQSNDAYIGNLLNGLIESGNL